MLEGNYYFLINGERTSWIDSYREAISESGLLWHGLNKEPGREQEVKARIVSGRVRKNIIFHGTMLLELDEGYIKCVITRVTPPRSDIRSRRPILRENNEIVLLHEIVAKYFVPNPQEYKFVEHIDGNFRNNHYTNLRWSNVPYKIQYL